MKKQLHKKTIRLMEIIKNKDNKKTLTGKPRDIVQIFGKNK